MKESLAAMPLAKPTTWPYATITTVFQLEARDDADEDAENLLHRSGQLRFPRFACIHQVPGGTYLAWQDFGMCSIEATKCLTIERLASYAGRPGNRKGDFRPVTPAKTELYLPALDGVRS